MNATNNNILTTEEFTDKIKQHERALMNHARNLTKNYDDAQDLFQDTLVRSYKFKDKYLVDYSFYGWLRRIMTNLYINNYHRKKQPIVSQDVFGENLLPGLSDEDDNSSECNTPPHSITMMTQDDNYIYAMDSANNILAIDNIKGGYHRLGNSC